MQVSRQAGPGQGLGSPLGFPVLGSLGCEAGPGSDTAQGQSHFWRPSGGQGCSQGQAAATMCSSLQAGGRFLRALMK